MYSSVRISYGFASVGLHSAASQAAVTVPDIQACNLSSTARNFGNLHEFFRKAVVLYTQEMQPVRVSVAPDD